MILPAQEIRKLRPLNPFVERTVAFGATYGLRPAGYVDTLATIKETAAESDLGKRARVASVMEELLRLAKP